MKPVATASWRAEVQRPRGCSPELGERHRAALALDDGHRRDACCG
jgi:hypothetical protein